MKKRFYTFFAVAVLLFISSAATSRDKVIKFEETPENVQLFIANHFKDIPVTYVEKDDGHYEVHLQNGFEIEFDRKGEWRKIDGRRNAVPQNILALVPESIVSYTKANYADRHIVKVKKYRSGRYEVELSGRPDIELKFSNNGDFERLDD